MLYRFLFSYLFLSMVAVPYVSADFNMKGWQYRSLVSAGPQLSEYVLLELPKEFFSYLKPDLSDLRVASGDGEVSYAASIAREADTFSVLPTRMFDLSSVSGESTSFVADLGKSGEFHNALTIETVSENFRRIVEVSGSNDRSSWRMLTSQGQIYDYTVKEDIKPVKVMDTRVSYPDATYRYLLVKVLDRGDTPLKIIGVKVARQVLTPAGEISHAPAKEVSQDAKERTTEIILDLGVAGIPHRRAEIQTGSTNFNRAVAIYDSEDRKDWRLLSHVYIYKVATAKFTGDLLGFGYPESNRRYLRVSVKNGDDRPIDIGNVTLYGVVRNILFRSDPGKEYYVYLGNPEAKRPQYDIEKISPYVETTELTRVSAGPVAENAVFVAPEPPKKPFTERYPYVLPVSLGAVVAVLAFMLLRVVVRAKTP